MKRVTALLSPFVLVAAALALATLAGALSLAMPARAHAAELEAGVQATHDVSASTWSDLHDALQVDDSYIKLTADVKFGEGGGPNESAALTVPANTKVTLDLNGHIVDRALTEAVEGGSVIGIAGVLTIADSAPETAHSPAFTFVDPLSETQETAEVVGGIITGGYAVSRSQDQRSFGGGGVLVENDAHLIMTGGAICKNRATVGTSDGGGGGVAVKTGGVVDLSGTAAICGNISEGDGGGIWLYSGALNMDGKSSIISNLATNKHGGGVSGQRTAVAMKGNSLIAGNKASFGINGWGGGIDFFNLCTLTMENNAAIVSNVASGRGGGVSVSSFFASNQIITMKDNARIAGNSAGDFGGGVYIQSDLTVLNMGGEASIAGNNAGSDGGGVFADSKSTVNMSEDAAIANNRARGDGGGVRLWGEAVLTMDGGNIVDNMTYGHGGGVDADSGATFTVAGHVVVDDNQVLDENDERVAESNVYGPNWDGPMAHPITVTGALDAGSSIGITQWGVPTAGAPVAFLAGFAENNPGVDPMTVFSADEPYKLTLSETGEIQLSLPESYNLWVAGVQVNDLNCSDVFGDGTVSYNPETKVLTLDGYDTGSNPGFYRYGALYADIPDLTIRVASDSVICASQQSASANAQSAVVVGKSTTLDIPEGVTLDLFGPETNPATNCRVIQIPNAESTLSVTGAGLLNVTGTPYSGWAIRGYGSVSVDGPDVTVSVASNVHSGSYSICLYETSANVNSGTLTLVATGVDQYLTYNGGDTVTAAEGLAIYLGTGPDNLEMQSGQQYSGRRQGYLKVCEPFTYDLWVAGVQVTKYNAGDLTVIDGVDAASGGYVRFDPETGTLYLKDATITNRVTGSTYYLSSGIFAKMDLTIEAEGENSVTGVTDGSSDHSYGICIEGADAATGDSFGIDFALVDGAVLTCTGGDAPDDSRLSISSHGVYASPNDGAPVNVSGKGTLNAFGGMAGELLFYSFGLGAGKYSQSGDVAVNAVGGKAVYGSYGFVNNGPLAVTGGSFEAKSLATAGTHRALYYAAGDDVTVGPVRASASADGSGAVDYEAADNAAYNWFMAPAYLVSFDVNGGSGEMAPAVARGGEGFVLPDCGFGAPAGMQFDGWDLGAPGEAVEVAADVTVSAQWAPAPAPGEQMGEDGTPCGRGASAGAAEAAVLATPDNADPPGSAFGPLALRATKAKKSSVKLGWKRPAGAASYVVYGNACGKKNAFQKLATTKSNKATFKKVAGKKVRKGTYYKFVVVALDANNRVVSTSKGVHVATPGGKVGNHKKVTTKAKRGKVALKRGKSFKLGARAVPASKKLKVKKHRALKYESANPAVATVSGKGVVKARAKGTTYVYAYAQNGVAAKVKVTVK